MPEPMIEIQNLSKRYRIGTAESYSSLRDSFAGMFKFGKNNPTSTDFWALKDINLKIEKGETLGIIGRNGAGKSTLLKILSQITPPTTGKITMRGRVASLLEVGTGFHQELTGRENIYLNGAILGMTRREIDKKFDEIVAFSEIDKFLDTPVKRYSSGMYVRLAFAVAAHLEPEILIVDEVLAVGDMQFQKKCLGKMKDISTEDGRTVLFVSHNLASVSALCNKAVVLDKGKIVASGSVDKCLAYYAKGSALRSGDIIEHAIYKSDHFRIKKITCNGSPEDFIQITDVTKPIELEITIEAQEKCRVALESFLKDSQGNHVGVCVPGHMDSERNIQLISCGSNKLLAKINLPKLNKGNYYLDLNFTEPGVQRYVNLMDSVSLDVLGYHSEGGHVFEASLSGAGYQILDGSFKVY